MFTNLCKNIQKMLSNRNAQYIVAHVFQVSIIICLFVGTYLISDEKNMIKENCHFNFIATSYYINI